MSVLLAWMVPRGSAAGISAIEAVKLLPKEHRARVARIEARDGTPEPERWHILVHDRAAENGLKEFVVADGVIAAERGISQFAESLTPEQMLGDAVRFDSDRAAQIVQQYALVNGLTVANIAYQLRKDAAASVPLWRLTCYDPIGRNLGSLTITATKGAVISHQGFEVEPAPVEAEPRERLSTAASTQVARDGTVRPPRGRQRETPPPKKGGFFDRLFGGGRPTPRP